MTEPCDFLETLNITYLIHTCNLTTKIILRYRMGSSDGEGEVVFFSAKRWDRRNGADLIESLTLCHDPQAVWPYQDSNPLCLTILAAMSEDYTTVPQHLLVVQSNKLNTFLWLKFKMV